MYKNWYFLFAKTINCVWNDHRDKIKVLYPVVKDLISNKLIEEQIEQKELTEDDFLVKEMYSSSIWKVGMAFASATSFATGSHFKNTLKKKGRDFRNIGKNISLTVKSALYFLLPDSSSKVEHFTEGKNIIRKVLPNVTLKFDLKFDFSEDA